MDHDGTTTPGAAACWKCGEPKAGIRFCGACGTLQPPAEVDYFALLEMPRKLTLDAASLEKRFYALSWKLHPDNFAQRSEQERGFSLGTPRGSTTPTERCATRFRAPSTSSGCKGALPRSLKPAPLRPTCWRKCSN